MTQIIVRDSMEQQLAQATGTIEVLGASGCILGHFVPSLQGQKSARLEPQIDEEELERRFAEGGGRTLEEILKDLRKSGSCTG